MRDLTSKDSSAEDGAGAAALAMLDDTKEKTRTEAAKRMRVGFERVDGYLLGEAISKPDVVADLLASRSASPAAAPFYRALEAVGTRAADEAFVAIRLIVANQTPSDDAVRRLRGLAAVARACARDDHAALIAAFRKDGAALADLERGTATEPASTVERERLGRLARQAYFAALQSERK